MISVVAVARKGWRLFADRESQRVDGSQNALPAVSEREAALGFQFVNRLLAENGWESVVEFGCSQARELALLGSRRYLGLSPSRVVVERCRARFGLDEHRSFSVHDVGLDAARLQIADVALALDAGLARRRDLHWSHLFASARKAVVTGSGSSSPRPTRGHAREIVEWVSAKQPEWRLASSAEQAQSASSDQCFASGAELLAFSRVAVDLILPR